MDDTHKMPEVPDNPNYEITGDLVDHYWFLINYLSGMIKASEIKAGLILSFYGIILNLYFKYLDIFLEMAKNDWFIITFMGLWLVVTILSIYFSFKCFLPMILGSYDKNVFFFDDVIKGFGTIKEYSKHLYQVSNEKEILFGQLGEQVFINAKIASTKFGFVNKSIRLLALNIVLLFIFLFTYSVRTFSWFF
ncbi:hypothetical protein P872_00180 [Rhodonellum psychrophilum GCM71 = DSM 17998]|uniref:Pycsar effector protein domain-containing protein n=2 Tax=Rhodonellum TaxID=336827 RepID=U5C5P5_9BACT|nr:MULTISPECIES: Pycsar system effector family protein [Rhodonellum]ERM83527.1 hypothetical protein P872_00180 [Rhodonellum psychrophilum GCM71 = DSM 17998]MDO9552381.1 DUF5706 domain-containing protein [Rhodonellum sp.]SDY52125.1 hypothetical protein SAMN05444412_101410 [Rhodonellum ikkaensis]